MSLSVVDRNGVSLECVAEAFDTKWNVLILLYPVRALTSSMIIFRPALTTMPAGDGSNAAARTVRLTQSCAPTSEGLGRARRRSSTGLRASRRSSRRSGMRRSR